MKTHPANRIAVVGIGNELRGDDAAGLEVVRRLKKRLKGHPEQLLLIEAGPVPENFTGPLRRFQPEMVLLVDAALMGEEPGALRHLDWKEAAGFPSSSHTLPLETFAAYLVGELGCEVRLLGLQPGGDELGAPISEAMDAAVNRAVAWIDAARILPLPWEKSKLPHI